MDCEPVYVFLVHVKFVLMERISPIKTSSTECAETRVYSLPIYGRCMGLFGVFTWARSQGEQGGPRREALGAGEGSV